MSQLAMVHVTELSRLRARFRVRSVWVLVPLLALGSVGCSGDDDDAIQTPHADVGEDAGADAESDAGNGDEPDAGGDEEPDAGDDPDAGNVDDSDAGDDDDAAAELDAGIDDDAATDADTAGKIDRIEVTPASLTLLERRTTQLEAKAFDENDHELDVDVAWEVDDSALATIDEDGLLEALRPGTVRVLAIASGNVGEALITIEASTPTLLVLEAPATDIPIDTTVELRAYVVDDDGYELFDRPIVFESDDETIFTVSADGTATALDVGQATIRARSGSFENTVELRGVHRFTTIFDTWDHTCALTAEGRAWCWGQNDKGQLGNGTKENATKPVRVAVDDDTRFTTLALAQTATCGLTPDKDVWCWGSNTYLQLGQPEDVTEATIPIPLTDRHYEAISAMSSAFCGLDADGHAHCWGHNQRYALGDPDLGTTKSATPVAVSAPADEDAPVAFTELSHGWGFSCGLSTTGFLYCWGDGANGQLGDGTYQPKANPVRPLGSQTVRHFGIGPYTVCAVTSDDSTYCWGDNAFALLVANPSAAIQHQQTPFLRFEASAIIPTTLALAWSYAYALDTEGRAHYWGFETGGHLWEVNGGPRFSQLIAGLSHVCGLATDGKVYCWGDNSYGQLGTGDTQETTAPTPVYGQ